MALIEKNEQELIILVDHRNRSVRKASDTGKQLT